MENIRKAITEDPANSRFTKKGYQPLFVAHPSAKLVIVGHAPGIKAQETNIPWNDESGRRLIEWLGIDSKTFYDKTKVALIPMDFYYQGKGKTGDLPPRKEFAEKWHSRILDAMPNVGLMVLTGQYANRYYLKKDMKKNLTETVKAFDEYLPKYFPLVHPSPLNFRWHAKNPWFMEEVIPRLREEVKKLGIC